MEKMCTAKTAIDNGYTTDLTMDEKECITTEEFLGHFSKEHYSARINGNRQSNQLFPFADVEETKIILEPHIQFNNDDMIVKYNSLFVINTFTLENVDVDSLSATIRNDSNSGSTNNGTVHITGNKVSMILDENNGSTAWDYTVTLTGNRIDGEGTYSKKFTIKQWYRVVLLDLLVAGFDDGWQLVGNGGDIFDDGGSAGVNAYLKSGGDDSENIFDSKRESISWTFIPVSSSSIEINYILRARTASSNWVTIKEMNGNTVQVTIRYNDVKNYESAQLSVQKH